MADADPRNGCPMRNGGEIKARSLLGRQNKDWWPDALRWLSFSYLVLALCGLLLVLQPVPGMSGRASGARH